MKLSNSALAAVHAASDVLPGNIYPAKGGKMGKEGTLFWLVVSVSNSGAHLIGFNSEGQPCSTASYLTFMQQKRGAPDDERYCEGALSRKG